MNEGTENKSYERRKSIGTIKDIRVKLQTITDHHILGNLQIIWLACATSAVAGKIPGKVHLQVQIFFIFEMFLGMAGVLNSVCLSILSN